MGKLIKAAKSLKAKQSTEIPYKKLKNEVSFKTKDKKQKKGHVLKISNPVNGGIRRKILSKKEKQKQKTIKIKQGIDKTIAAFKEDKAKKKREKRPIIGDLKPLLDSLPSLDKLISIRGSSNKTGIAAIDRKIPREPKTKKEKKAAQIHTKTEAMLDRFDAVQKVWRNPEFQKNPRKLIAEQIRQRRQANIENEMET
jgi:hypothetical protein